MPWPQACSAALRPLAAPRPLAGAPTAGRLLASRPPAWQQRRRWTQEASTRTPEGEARAALREKIRKRTPHLAAKEVPKLYRMIFGLPDKLVLPGKGSNWFWKSVNAESMDLVYNFKSWDRLHEPYRNVKLFTLFGFARSDVNRRLLFPDLTFVAACSGAICLYNNNLAPIGEVIPGLHKTHDFLLHSNMICLPMEPFVMIGAAIGLLSTFRTQASYARYVEAREIWTDTQSNCRELCSRILTRIPMPRSNAEKHPLILDSRIHGGKLVMTFPHALKYHCTADGCNLDVDPDGDEIEQKRERFHDELSLIWDLSIKTERAYVDRLLHKNVKNWPVQVCQELSYLNANQFAAPHPGGLGAPNSEGFDKLLMALQKCTADAEKIIMSPVYTPYTKFTCRVIYTFVLLLTPALYPFTGPAMTTPVALAIAWLFFGIDDIGRRVEMPFDNLALWQFVEQSDLSCEQLIRQTEDSGESPDHWLKSKYADY